MDFSLQGRCAEALLVAETAGDLELQAKVLHNQSNVHEDRGDFAKAEELLDLAHLAYQDAGREVMPGQLWSGKANLRMDQGQLAEAKTFLDMALQAFREVGDRRNEAMMLNNTGYLLRNMGRMAEAEEYHLRSLEIRRDIGDRVRQAGWTGKEGEILARLVEHYLDAGDLEAAAPLVGALSALAPGVRSLQVQARYAWAREERDKAARLMEEARTLAGDASPAENQALLANYRGE